MATTLKAKVDLNTSAAEAKLKRLVKQIERVNRAASGTNSRTNKVNENLRRVGRSSEKAFSTKPVNNFNKSLKTSESILENLYQKMRYFGAWWVAIKGAGAIANVSDMVTGAKNRLNNVNAQAIAANGGNAYDANGQYTKAVTDQTAANMDKIYAAAQRSRAGYGDMMANVSKTMTLAPGAFKNNLDNAIKFQEIMAKAYTVGGASAEEQASSMYQMVQALGSGVLQGDELRSVREGAPLAYQAIEKFAQGVYDTDEALKDLASEGKITSDMVVAAMMDASDGIEKAFNASNMTFGQAFTILKNTALKAFEPVLDMLNRGLNSEAGQAALKGLESAIVNVAAACQYLLSALGVVFNFIYEHWNIFQPIFMLLIFMISTLLVSAATSALTKIAMSIITMLTNPLFLVIALIGLLILLIWNIAKTAQNTCDFISQVAFALMWIILGILTVVLVYYLAVGTLMMGIPVLIGLIILAILLLVVTVFLKYTKQVVGAWYWMKAVIHNIITFIGQLVLALWNVIKAVGTNIGIAMSNPWEAAKAAFWGWVGDVLEGIKWLEPALNAIAELFGLKGFTLSNTISQIRGKEGAIKKQLGYVDVGDAFLSAFDGDEYRNLSNAYDEGSAVGAHIQDKINGWGANFKNSLSTGSLPSPTDPSYALNTDTYDLGNAPGSGTDDVGKIAKNTDKIADTMDMTETDLKYLMDLAERDAINRFTTAEIKVNMNNNNNISETADIDGIISALSDKLYEELDVVAAGVHY